MSSGLVNCLPGRVNHMTYYIKYTLHYTDRSMVFGHVPRVHTCPVYVYQPHRHNGIDLCPVFSVSFRICTSNRYNELTICQFSPFNSQLGHCLQMPLSAPSVVFVSTMCGSALWAGNMQPHALIETTNCFLEESFLCQSISKLYLWCKATDVISTIHGSFHGLWGVALYSWSFYYRHSFYYRQDLYHKLLIKVI